MSFERARKSNKNEPELDNELRQILEMRNKEILKTVKNTEDGEEIEGMPDEFE